jgi:hypothetical protein
MTENEGYPLGTIVNNWGVRQSYRYEIIEYLGVSEKTNRRNKTQKYYKFLVWELKANSKEVKGKPYETYLPADLKEGTNKIGDYQSVSLNFPKPNSEMISAGAQKLLAQKEGVEAKEIVVDGIKPAYLMTKEEYKKEVTPHIKSLQKFLKKNAKYLKKEGYYGLIYETYPEFIKKEPTRISWLKSSKADLLKMAKGNWLEEGHRGEKSGRTIEPIPSKDLKEYEDLKSTLISYLGEEGLKTFNSDETNSPKRSIRRAIDGDLYKDLLLDGTINYGNLTTILSDAKLKVPAKLEKLATEVVSKGVTSATVEQRDKALDKFYNTLFKYIRPSLDELWEGYYSRYWYQLSEYYKFQNKKQPTKYWQQEFCEFLGKRCKKIKVTSQYGRVSEKLVCCNESVELQGEMRVTYKNNYKISDNWHEDLKKEAEEYIKAIVQNLSRHLLGYIPITMSESIPILPKINRARIQDTMGGKLIGHIALEYPNGFQVGYDVNMIIAGGYNIQKRHYRYLTTPVVDGKTISQDQLIEKFDFFQTDEKDVDKDSDKDFLSDKIETFEMLLDIETDDDEREFLKEKIEAFKMMKDI